MATRQQSAFYEDALGQCTRAGVAVSCVTAPGLGAEPLDVSNLQWLSGRTGGDTLHLPSFTTACMPALEGNLRHWAAKMQASAYGCVVKLRTSKGLSCSTLVAPWPAAGASKDGSAFEVSRLSADTSFAFTLYAEEEPEQEDAFYTRPAGRRNFFVQVAVLYSSSKGERLLRVHTTVLGLAPSIRSAYQTVNIGPLMALLVKQAALMALERKASSKVLPRDVLLEFCLQVMASHKRLSACGDREGVLVMGKKLQLLPLYVLAARKLFYTAMSGTMDKAHTEEFLRNLVRLPIHSLLSALCPRIYSLPATAHPGAELPRAWRAALDVLSSGQAPAYLVATCFGTWFYQPESGGLSPSSNGERSPCFRAGAQRAEGKAQVEAADQSRANPETTPEGRAAERAELWQSAEELSQRLRESLAPSAVWMPLQELPRWRAGEVGWADKIFMASLFVEDEGVTEMGYGEWLGFLQAQVAGMAAQ